MMFVTAKVNLKKILLILVGAAAVLLALILMFGGKSDASQTSAPAMPTNDARVQFLKGFGWDVTTSPKESSQVRIPQETSEVFDRYNALQKQQGYDLSDFAGKKVMRYVYQVNNFPGATEPVYATLLVYKNRIIGGDITDTSPKGKIHTFQMPTGLDTTNATEPPVSTVPATLPSTNAPEE